MSKELCPCGMSIECGYVVTRKDGTKFCIQDMNCFASNKWLVEHDKQVREETIEFISDKLIYPLLDECDRRIWEHINYIELAEEWIKVLNDNPYPKVKNYTEARKRDLRQWIAEQLKGKEK